MMFSDRADWLEDIFAWTPQQQIRRARGLAAAAKARGDGDAADRLH